MMLMDFTAMRHLALLALLLTLAGCSTTPLVVEPGDGAPRHQIDVSTIPDATPRAEPYSRYGNPERYEVFGKTYTTLKGSKGHIEQGIASWYGTKFHGRRTSSGEPYDLYDMTAAHKTLPLPTYAQVTNLDNGRSVVVKINDRGPFHDDRIIDLSYAAAMKLDIVKSGTGRVELRAIDPHNPDAHLARSPGFIATANAADPGAVELGRVEPARVAAATPIATESIFLQAGAFSSFGNADSLRSRIGAIAASPIVISKSIDPQPLYRVRIGPLGSAEEAQQMAQRLSAIGITTSRVSSD